MGNYGWQRDGFEMQEYSWLDHEELIDLCFDDPGVENILDELWYAREVRDDVDTYLRLAAEEAGCLGGDDEW